MKLTYSLEEAAEQSHQCKTSLYKQIKSGHLKAKKIGRKTIILHEDLTAFLAALPDFSSGAGEDNAAR